MPLIQYSMQMAMKMFKEKPGLMTNLANAITSNDADTLKSIARESVAEHGATEEDLRQADAAMEEIIKFKKEDRTADVITSIPGMDQALSQGLDLNKLSETGRATLEAAAKARAETLGLPLEIPEDRNDLEAAAASALGLAAVKDDIAADDLLVGAISTSIREAVAANETSSAAAVALREAIPADTSNEGPSEEERAKMLKDAMKELGL